MQQQSAASRCTIQELFVTRKANYCTRWVQGTYCRWLLAVQVVYVLGSDRITVVLQDLQSKELPTTRIQPDRRWFGNTRVIGQKQLEQFREEMSSKINDSYTVLLREKKLPLQLLEDPERKVGGKQKRADLLGTQPFSDTFGPNRKRKRPKLSVEGYADLVQNAVQSEEQFVSKAGSGAQGDFDEFKDAVSLLQQQDVGQQVVSSQLTPANAPLSRCRLDVCC